MQTPFSARAVEDDLVTIVRVVGELDLATTPVFEGVIEAQQARGRPVRLDLEELEFIDSTGMRALMSTVNDAKVNGWNLSVAAGLQPPVRRALELTGLLAALPVDEAWLPAADQRTKR